MIAWNLSSNDSGSNVGSSWEEAEGLVGMVVPLVKLDTSSWNLAEISARSWNTVVSLLLGQVQGNPDHAPAHNGKPFWPMALAICHCRQLVPMVGQKVFSFQHHGFVLVGLELVHLMSAQTFANAILAFGRTQLAAKDTGPKPWEGCGLLFEVHVCYLGEHFLSNAYGSSKGFSWQSHIL